jgi:hypothetical protein
MLHPELRKRKKGGAGRRERRFVHAVVHHGEEGAPRRRVRVRKQ